jgi:hypothetical protein
MKKQHYSIKTVKGSQWSMDPGLMVITMSVSLKMKNANKNYLCRSKIQTMSKKHKEVEKEEIVVDVEQVYSKAEDFIHKNQLQLLVALVQ